MDVNVLVSIGYAAIQTELMTLNAHYNKITSQNIDVSVSLEIVLSTNL